MKSLSTPIAVLFLAACTSFNVGNNYTLDGKTQEGLAVVSLSYEGIGSGISAKCEYRDTANAEATGYIMADTRREPADWHSPTGRLAYFSLTPGRYEFFRCGFARQTGGGGQYWSVGPNGVPTNNNPAYSALTVPVYAGFDGEPFSARFEILPGRATYVGNLHFVWNEVQQRGRVIVTDRSDRDLALVLQRLPKLRPEQIKKVTN